MTHPWMIRSAEPSDLNFIYATWMDSYRCDSAFAKSIRTSVFTREYHKVIDRLLYHAHATIACNPEEPNVIAGYLIHEPQTGDAEAILHYVFIKECFRRMGVARSLFLASFPRAGAVCSHKTRTSQPIFDRFPQLTFNPFVLFQGENRVRQIR